MARSLSDDAKKGIRTFGLNPVMGYFQHRDYQTKIKGAQEAHEAIRPTNISTTEAGKDDGEQRLYKLIWQRTIASQMADAKLLKTVIQIPALDDGI